MLGAIFFGCLLVGLYPFVIYPVLAALLSRLVLRPVAARDGFVPRVTVVIAAYNEATHIAATVRNKLDQDYPPAELDIIVVSDGSTDATDAQVREIAAQEPRVRLVRQQPRQGKTAALNMAIAEAAGEIVVISDANSLYAPDAIRRLVANFADEEVGYVSGQMKYVTAGGSLVGDGCTAYMRYENRLRAIETRLGSIVGVDGGVDAVRRRLYRPMRADQLPDFVLPLDVVAQHHRVVFEPLAVLHEEALGSGSSEYRMRVRVALRAFWALKDMRHLLNPLRYGLFSWQLFSHKVMRYLAFLPFGIAAVLNWFLLDQGPVYQLAALGQLLFAAMLLVAASGRRAVAGVELPVYCQYFALLNWASAVAFLQFLRGEKKVIWQPRQG